MAGRSFHDAGRALRAAGSAPPEAGHGLRQAGHVPLPVWSVPWLIASAGASPSLCPSHPPSVRARHAVDLFERETVPYVGAQVCVAVQKQVDGAVGVDQDEVRVALLGVVGVFGEPVKADEDAFLANVKPAPYFSCILMCGMAPFRYSSRQTVKCGSWLPGCWTKQLADAHR